MKDKIGEALSDGDTTKQFELWWQEFHGKVDDHLELMRPILESKGYSKEKMMCHAAFFGGVLTTLVQHICDLEKHLKLRGLKTDSTKH